MRSTLNQQFYRVRNFRGRVSIFNQSEARKQCFLASDWLKFETLPRKFRTLKGKSSKITFTINALEVLVEVLALEVLVENVAKFFIIDI